MDADGVPFPSDSAAVVAMTNELVNKQTNRRLPLGVALHQGPILSAAQKRARASGSILRFALGRGYIAYWQRFFHCWKLVENWWETGEKCQQAGGES